MMDLTIIGRYGPYAAVGGAPCSCYLVQENGTSIVLDMGPGSLGVLRKHIDVTKIDGFYFSHLHYDHVSDFLAFQYLLEELNHTVTVYTHREFSALYNMLFEHPNVKVVNIDEDADVDIGCFRLTFTRLKHTVTDYGVRIEGLSSNLCYTGDTMYTAKLIDLFRSCDAALADCSKPVGFKGPHITADKAKELAIATGTRILATHVTPDNIPYDEFKNTKNIEIVEDEATYHI